MAKQKLKKKSDDRISPNEQKLRAGIGLVKNHPLFRRLSIGIEIADKYQLPKGTAAISLQSGDVLANPFESREIEEWAYLLAHCMMHLCFGHFDEKKMPGYAEPGEHPGEEKWIVSCDRKLWNMACDIYIQKFLTDIKFGTPMTEITDGSLLASDEIKIYHQLAERHISPDSNVYGTAGRGEPDMHWNGDPEKLYWWKNHQLSYAAEFAYAVSDSVRTVIDQAGGRTDDGQEKSIQTRASEWFINHYPLLGGLASGFKIIEVGYGSQSAKYHDISIAAVDVSQREIYVNSSAGLTLEEWKFVLAHEYLHAGLQHHERCAGRDPYLWNVACDYVVNGWLSEMHIGIMPMNGLLYDEALKDFSAEEIYDILVKDLKKNSKLQTFRGYGKSDILDRGYAESKLKPANLDEFCKNALRSGLEYHTSSGRGFIPAGLVEEIRALSMPPIPWDVELAKWFDINFAPIEKRRTYARPSRRQDSTPDIPRPSYIMQDIPEYSRTYGVIIDTSGSMSAKLIGYALGAAASYSAAKDVPLVRVVFCDAFAYDIGYVSPDDIAGRVEVRGRGGTVIQPAVDLLEQAKDFPRNAPILIITDGEIEEDLEVHHQHAFLIPKGNRLPFRPKGDVFCFEESHQ